MNPTTTTRRGGEKICPSCGVTYQKRTANDSYCIPCRSKVNKAMNELRMACLSFCRNHGLTEAALAEYEAAK